MKKHNAQRLHRNRRKGRGARGSALLVSLMIMVGLSLLGLAFVASSETENAISLNERNKTQTAALAEAGAKAVVQWFQDPVLMDKRGLLPKNDKDQTIFKQQRTVNAYKGFYKPDGGLLFDTPFGPREQDMFFGNEENADVLIVRGRNDESNKFLDDFNNALFYSKEGGEIVSIRIYAPPNVGGSLIGGFWVAGQRYGIATIAVVAEKKNGNNVVAQSVCRLVLAPFPLPGPSGAVQAIGSIDTNGNYEVHWGAIEAEQNAQLFVKREASAFPWFDAYDRPYIEYGIDSSTVWEKEKDYGPYAKKFPEGHVVRPTDPDLAKQFNFMIVEVQNTKKSGATEPTWIKTIGTESYYGGDVKYRTVAPVSYPISTGTGLPYAGYDNHNWLSEMLGRTVDDPWFHVRGKQRIKGKTTGDAPLNDPHPFDYATAPAADWGAYADNTLNAKDTSNYFQYQTHDDRPNYKQVRVPRFDYDFWKAAALAGRGQKGVYYLEWDGTNYTNGLKAQTVENWLKEGPGFYFFDTANKMNPQNGGPGKLVDVVADPCGAKGVVYLNVKSVKSTGCKASNGWYNQPGEPYRDIGYRKVNEQTVPPQIKGNFTTDAGGNFVREKAYNNEWDYQDLPWSNGATQKNGYFDVCMGYRPLYRESTNEVIQRWVPLPYYPGCKVGNNFLSKCDCSEPFKPYLNIQYTGKKQNLQALWDDPNVATAVFAKVTGNEKPTGTPIACMGSDVASKAGQERCATNARDKRGALAMIDDGASQAGIGFEGVLYNEGSYDSTGNAAYFGSVVVAGAASPNGTQEIWYDACLAGDCWPPKHIPFPRVMITSTQIQ